MLFHHAAAQAELLDGPQVVQECPLAVGESQRGRCGPLQDPGGHESGLIAHVVGIHVVGAEAAGADGQVLEGVDGGCKRVGSHEGHELGPIGCDDDVVGCVLRVADVPHHPGGHLGQQVVDLPAVSGMLLAEGLPAGVQFLHAFAAVGARVDDADEFFPVGEHPHGFVQQGGVGIADGEAAHVGALSQLGGHCLCADTYHGYFLQQWVIARQQRIGGHAADSHQYVRAFGTGFPADFFHHFPVCIPVAHADTQVFHVDGGRHAAGLQPVRQSAVQVFVAGSRLGIGVYEGDAVRRLCRMGGQERNRQRQDGEAKPV